MTRSFDFVFFLVFPLCGGFASSPLVATINLGYVGGSPSAWPASVCERLLSSTDFPTPKLVRRKLEAKTLEDILLSSARLRRAVRDVTGRFGTPSMSVVFRYLMSQIFQASTDPGQMACEATASHLRCSDGRPLSVVWEEAEKKMRRRVKAVRSVETAEEDIDVVRQGEVVATYCAGKGKTLSDWTEACAAYDVGVRYSQVCGTALLPLGPAMNTSSACPWGDGWEFSDLLPSIGRELGAVLQAMPEKLDDVTLFGLWVLIEILYDFTSCTIARGFEVEVQKKRSPKDAVYRMQGAAKRLGEEWELWGVVNIDAPNEFPHTNSVPLGMIYRVKKKHLGIVVVRGTFTATEWSIDLSFDQVETTGRDGAQGYTHLGFQKLASAMFIQLEAMLQRGDFRRVVFIGHSLGGAVASLLARDFAKRRLDFKVGFVTFGSPRFGDVNVVSEVHFMAAIKPKYAVMLELDPIASTPCLFTPSCSPRSLTLSPEGRHISSGRLDVYSILHPGEAYSVPMPPVDGMVLPRTLEKAWARNIAFARHTTGYSCGLAARAFPKWMHRLKKPDALSRFLITFSSSPSFSSTPAYPIWCAYPTFPYNVRNMIDRRYINAQQGVILANASSINVLSDFISRISSLKDKYQADFVAAQKERVELFAALVPRHKMGSPVDIWDSRWDPTVHLRSILGLDQGSDMEEEMGGLGFDGSSDDPDIYDLDWGDDMGHWW